MIDNKFAVIKFISRHKLLFGCLTAAWIIGMIFTVILIGRSSHTKLRVQRLSHPLIHPLQHNRLPPASSFKMVKALRYCNPPSDITIGQEGQPPLNGTLEFVSVVIRHGDRSSLLPVKDQLMINCSAESNPLLENFIYDLSNHNGSLDNLSNFLNHLLFPKPYCIQTFLTLTGAHQHLVIGQLLHRAYIEGHGLLSQNWTSQQIKLYSTRFSRAFQSAIAFLYTFLPNFNISSINMAEVDSIWFCQTDSFCQCPILPYLEMLADLTVDTLLQDHPDISNLIKRLNPMVKFPGMPDIPLPIIMLDSLFHYACHHADLPCDSNTSDCVTLDDIKKLTSYVELQQLYLMEDSNYTKLSMLRTHGFLMNLIEDMKSHINGNSSYRFKLHSGHDATLEALSVALSFNDGSLIPYASRIVFELYNCTFNNTSEHAVKVLYNGFDVTTKLPFCKVDRDSYGENEDVHDYSLCLFEKFRKFVEDDFVSEIGASFEEACTL